MPLLIVRHAVFNDLQCRPNLFKMVKSTSQTANQSRSSYSETYSVVIHTVSQSINQLVIKSPSQSVSRKSSVQLRNNRPVSWTVIQSISQSSVSQSINKPDSQKVIRLDKNIYSVRQTVIQSIRQLVNQSTSQSVVQYMSQSVNQLPSQSARKSSVQLRCSYSVSQTVIVSQSVSLPESDPFS